MRRWRSLVEAFRVDTSGVAAIEYAFAAPVLFAGIFLALETGRVLYSKAEFEYAVSRATRLGMVNKNAGTTQVRLAFDQSLMMLDPIQVTAFNLSEVTNVDKTKTATLTASYRINFLAALTDDLAHITINKTVAFTRMP
jgi:Flp pilus assembly protein TadG